MAGGYTILMGKDNMDYFNALIKDQFAPSEKTKAELERLSKKATADLERWQNSAELIFVEEHGQQILDVIKEFSDKYFLVGKSRPFYLSWVINTNYDNDDYWAVRFWKGKFSYVQEICGGYGGEVILEEDISQERLMELMESKK